MKSTTLRLTGFLVTFAALLLINCDPFREDLITPDRQITLSSSWADYYVLSGSSAAIDLKSLVSSSYTQATLEISENPRHGKVSSTGDFLYKYEPDKGFSKGLDQFRTTISSNGQVLKTITHTIHVSQNVTDFPCGLYGMKDLVITKTGLATSIRVLDNDLTCGVSKSEVRTSIYSKPKHGRASLVGDSVVVYEPEFGFVGNDELVYKISAGANSQAKSESLGIISVGVMDQGIELREAWTNESLPSGISTFFLIDQNTGYAGASAGIYKTTDGAISWTKVIGPIPFDGSAGAYFDIEAAYFIDANTGFIGLGKWVNLGGGPPGGVWACKGGLLKTTNGGVTWSLVNFEHAVTSIFFTSPTTGFIGTSQAPGDVGIEQIYKTANGGEGWQRVFSEPNGIGGISDIRFSNSRTGYAHDFGRILRTTNSGESWQVLVTNPPGSTPGSPNGVEWPISSLTVTNENIICAVFVTPDGSSGSRRIMRSVDGVNWTQTVEMPVSSVLLSPTGDLGIATGQEQQADHTWISTLYKSYDKGATWQRGTIDGNGLVSVFFVIPSGGIAYLLYSQDKMSTKIIRVH